MLRLLVFGNSASGKSTLARRLASEEALTHLDLDTLAWQPQTTSAPPERRPLRESHEDILRFISRHPGWVIEGCYSDLLAAAVAAATGMIYLKVPVEACVENARNRPWERHKYPSKAAQDANLAMLIEWIRRYEERDDTFSQRAHQTLYDGFGGDKWMLDRGDAVFQLRR